MPKKTISCSGEVYGRDLKRTADDVSDEDALTQLVQQVNATRIGEFIK